MSIVALTAHRIRVRRRQTQPNTNLSMLVARYYEILQALADNQVDLSTISQAEYRLLKELLSVHAAMKAQRYMVILSNFEAVQAAISHYEKQNQ